MSTSTFVILPHHGCKQIYTCIKALQGVIPVCTGLKLLPLGDKGEWWNPVVALPYLDV